MNSANPEIKTLIDYCEANLGDPTLWQTPAGYPDSLAMCLIDATYSPGSHYKSVVSVIRRYKSRHPSGNHHGAENLLGSITEANGPRKWAEGVVKNVRPTHTKSGVALKAEIIQQAARHMIDLEIHTVTDLRRVVEENPLDNPVRAGWLGLKSRSSGATYDYLLMLAGGPSLKPDRMVLRFLAQALGEDTEISPERADKLLTGTADHLGVDPRVVDHIVWRASSGRELTDLPE